MEAMDQLTCRSFNARICDDLCELLLSYLSFEDKIRLESVCKRFQRLVFNRQYILRVENKMNDRNNLFKLMVKRDYYSNDKQILINKTAFESVLKKCRAIREIAFNCEFNNREFAVKAIARHCHHLKAISMKFHDITEQTLKEFGHKFGPQLISIDFVFVLCTSVQQMIGTEAHELRDNHYKTLIRLCPNVQTLLGVKLSYFIDENIFLSKLTKIKLFYEESDERLVDSFVDKYKSCVKSLHILNGFSGLVLTENTLIAKINAFDNLEELKLTSIKSKEYSPQMALNIKNIGIKCQKLKSFSFSAQIESLIVSQLLESIRHYDNLRHLELDTFGSTFNVSTDHNQCVCVKTLQSYRQLTHLSLISLNLSDNFFTDIDQYLPQLAHLNISFNDEITNNTMNSLSKLSKLSVIVIKASKRHFISKERIDEGMCQLIANCPQLTSIQFFSRPNITYKTIDALIALALKRPKVHFRHLFADIDMRSKYSPYFTVIEIKNSHNLPKNLTIFTNF